MKRLHLIATVALVLGVAAVAYASGDAGQGAEAAHGLNWKDFLFRVVNFVLVFGVIAKLAGKKMVSFFRGRGAQIENQLADLDSRKAEAAKRLAEIEASISNLSAEKARIEDEYRRQGETLRDSIVAAAEVKAAQIRSQAAATAAARRAWPWTRSGPSLPTPWSPPPRPCSRRSLPPRTRKSLWMNT